MTGLFMLVVRGQLRLCLVLGVQAERLQLICCILGTSAK